MEGKAKMLGRESHNDEVKSKLIGKKEYQNRKKKANFVLGLYKIA